MTTPNYSLDDLKRSGLFQKDKLKLKITHLMKQELQELFPDTSVIAAYRIPYFDINKKLLDFYRLKLFHDESPSFDPAQQIKYWQPDASEPKLYFPVLTDWNKIKDNVSIPLCITEGEKKAAKACKEGIPCIGLGGVWSFQSKKRLSSLIKDFDCIDWNGRTVSIVYDNDLFSNEQVQKAQIKLAHELTKRGAIVNTLLLPQSTEKIGLDDYLVNHSKEEFDLLESLPFEECQELFKLNNEVAVIQDSGAIFNLHHNKLINLTAFNTLYANRFYNTLENGKLKKKPVGKAWMEWPSRREHPRLTYEPGKPKILDNNELNTWQGWGVDPVEGDVQPFHDLLNHTLSGDEEFKTWFLQWLAYPLAYPGTKLYQAVVLWSQQTGTGKTYIGSIMSEIYGDNYGVITQKELHGEYTFWCKHKQFILGDEITGTNKRHDADNIKNMITRDRLTVNEKFVPQYTIRDCANFLFTSNQCDAFIVERCDRRLAIKEVSDIELPNVIVKRVRAWLKNNGAAHLFHYLKNEVDISSFDPAARAPLTESKKDMIAMSFSDLDAFCESLVMDADSVLQFDGYKIDRDNFTIGQLIQLYDREGDKRTTSIAMSKALRRAGFRCKVVSVAAGCKKLWSVRNTKHWKKAPHHEFVADFDKSVIFLDRAKKKFKVQ